MSQPSELISHQYRYLATDLRNNQVLAELPCQGVSYSRKLSGIGEFTSKVKVNDRTLRMGLKEATSPGKMGLYILRDDQPVWGGVIWKRNYSSGNREISLAAKTFESYFYKRFQSRTITFNNTDQLDIARWLVTVSSDAAAALLIDVSNAKSGRLRERTMYRYEFKTVGEELEQLSALIDGFDWNITVYRDGTGAMRRRLDFYYPQAGAPLNTTQHVFEYPGIIKEFTTSEDAEGSGNSVWALGAGEGDAMITANSTDAGQRSQGWPIIEQSRSHKSVLVQATLQSHADADLDRLRTPVTVFEVSVRADGNPAFGSYDLGDWARFRIEDQFISPALDTYARITGISMAVSNEGLETVDITLGGNEATTDD